MSLYSLGESTSSGTHDALRTVAAPLTVSPPSRLACEMCGRTRLVSARVSRNPSSFVTDSAAYDSHSITSTRLKRASTRMACSMMLMRYFIASGVDSAHRVFFACPSAKVKLYTFQRSGRAGHQVSGLSWVHPRCSAHSKRNWLSARSSGRRKDVANTAPGRSKCRTWNLSHSFPATRCPFSLNLLVISSLLQCFKKPACRCRQPPSHP
mmetsp:Transcript_11068/g.41343  ORF Transcript_11068/g.41343 Transcript_11068/m.41343 type:complete len:209 (-) Transcript_11068:782-1408(-)